MISILVELLLERAREVTGKVTFVRKVGPSAICV